MKEDTRTDACRFCGEDFTQERKRGQPQRYCDAECRRKARARRCLAEYHGDASRGERTRKDWRQVLPLEILALPASDSRYRAARYSELRGTRIARCKYPECEQEFEVPNKHGHPPYYCSDECGRLMACLRSRIWREVNAKYMKERREATREERNARARQRYAEDAEYRQKWVDRALRKARRPDTRALRALRSALVRGSRQGELVYYEDLYERDRGICQLCLEPVSFAETTLDHTIPCIRGGPHVSSNLVIAHRDCNSRKSGDRHTPGKL